MFRNLLYFFALSSLAFGGVGQAQSQQAVEASRVEAAERLLDAVGYDATMGTVLDRLVDQMQKTLPGQINAKLDRPLPDDLMQQVLKVTDTHMRESFGRNRADLKRATALIYASQFSEAELRRLVELQSDPVMRKFQAKLPDILTQSIAIAQGLAERDRQRLESAIKTTIEEYFRSRGEVAPTISAVSAPPTRAES